MADRSTETTITFAHPFSLAGIGGMQPAGNYRLVTEEDEIRGLSFQAFQRTATLLSLPELSAPRTFQQTVPVDAVELAAALDADARKTAEDSNG